jgi:asparagine synthase (glutamine-hydrolysing)
MNSDLNHYLHDDILVKIDRTAMSHSLEGRVPLLDHRLVDFSLRLPLSMKLNKTGGKLILRKILEKYVPSKLFEREKRGFAIPIETLIRGPLRDWAEDLFDPVKMENEGILNTNVVRSKWIEHQSGKRNWQQQLWAILMFQSWLESNK